MNRTVVSIVLFCLLLLAITSPFAALAGLLLFLTVMAFMRTVWTIIGAGLTTPPEDSSSQSQ